MRALKMNFNGAEGVSVDWNATTNGLAGLVQKAANSIVTQAGSDGVVAGRGTSALKSLVGHGAYDLMAIQHTLNFAAMKASSDIKTFSPNLPAADSLSYLRAKLFDLSNGSVRSTIEVGNASGETTREITSIA